MVIIIAGPVHRIARTPQHHDVAPPREPDAIGTQSMNSRFGRRRGEFLALGREKMLTSLDELLGSPKLSAFGHPNAPSPVEQHTLRMTRYVILALGILLVLVGSVWTLQGANLLGGSFMTGSTQWLVIGLVVIVAGAALLKRAVRSNH
jgi:hypothetical protein